MTRVDEDHLRVERFQSTFSSLQLLIVILLLCGPFPGVHRKKPFLCAGELICPEHREEIKLVSECKSGWQVILINSLICITATDQSKEIHDSCVIIFGVFHKCPANCFGYDLSQNEIQLILVST